MLLAGAAFAEDPALTPPPPPPPVEAPAPPPTPAPEPPVKAAPSDVPLEDTRFAIWCQPVGAALFGVVSLANRSEQAWYVPVGFNLLVNGVEFAAELTVWNRNAATDAGAEVVGGSIIAGTLAVGPVFHIRSKHFAGLFIEPKLIVEIAHDSSGNTMGAVQVAGDLGYAIHWRALYLAFLFGLSAGYTNEWWGAAGILFANPAHDAFQAAPAPRVPKGSFTAGINLNGVRIGVAF